MGIESATYISDLNEAWPLGSDLKSTLDNHHRLTKAAIKTTFPNVTGAVTPTHTELNYVDGVTSAIQTQIDAKFDKAGGAITGDATIGGTLGVTGALSGTTGAFSGAVTGVTATAGDSTTKFATTAYVQGVAFTSALPNQTGNSGKFVTTDGANASWSLVPLAAGVSGVLPLANGGTNGGLTVPYGGTGAATFTDGGVLVGNGAGAFQATAVGSSGHVLTSNGPGTDPTFQAAPTAAAATQAEQEAASSTTVFATPARQQFHPSAAKVWLKCDAAGVIQSSYNVTSITDVGTGVVTVTIATDFSSADYVVNATAYATDGSNGGWCYVVSDTPQAAGAFTINYRRPGAADPVNYFIACFGDQ